MNELVVLFSWGPVTVTAYALCLMAGGLAALAVTCRHSRRALISQARASADGAGAVAIIGRGLMDAPACLSMGMAAILGGILGGRAVYVLTMLEFILVDLGGPAFLLQPWQGGYTLYGAVGGAMLGVALYAKATRRAPWQLMDLACPGGAIVIMAGRLGEAFTSQGLGDYVESEALMRFPFAVPNVFGDYQLPVFAYEAFAALIILIVCLRLAGRAREGRVTEVFVTLLGLSQIILESLREDEFIRFGFVRFNMLAAAVTLGAVFILSLRRRVKQVGWSRWQILRTAIFALGVGVVILIEFALDKSPVDNRLLYALMALTLTAMGFGILRESVHQPLAQRRRA